MSSFGELLADLFYWCHQDCFAFCPRSSAISCFVHFLFGGVQHLCFFSWRDLSKKNMFSLMIDSIAVSLLAGFQVLGDSSEYVWRSSLFGWCFRIWFWVIFQDFMMVLDPTVVWRNPLFYFFFGRRIEPAQNEHDTYTSQQKTYCRNWDLGILSWGHWRNVRHNGNYVKLW